MTISLEKIFFCYILQNKKYFTIVEPFFFKNAQIQFVYKCVREYMTKSPDIQLPSAKQIWEMINLSDKEDLVTKESLKNMLTTNLSDYDEKNFIIPRLNLFILSNRIKSSAGDIIDEARNIDTLTEFDDAITVASKIKLIVDEMNNTNFVQDENLGSDFDNPEDHIQDTSRFKVKSGFDTLDHLLGGGWDIQTLNCIMAETNNGKCCLYNTKLHIKDKKTGEISTEEIGRIFNKVTNKTGKHEKPLFDKFIESYLIDNLQVLTQNGWIDIQAIGKTIEYEEYTIKSKELNGQSPNKELICADNHIVYKCINMDSDLKKCDLIETYCKDLKLGDYVMTKDGPEIIIDLFKTNKLSNMFDLQLSEGSNHQFYTNDILSHNSLWMQNFATRTADLGYDVVYVTLEMSERKVMKRLGAMRLKLPINEYDELSKNTELIRKKIQSVQNSSSGLTDDIFNQKSGKIIVKFWAAGTANISDIDFFLTKLAEKKGIKPKLVIIDYITLIAPQKGVSGDNLYIKGKHLAEGLRAIAAKHGFPLITGIQVSKDAWNANDITLEQIPESKAIAETADTFFAIIRTEDMKRQNLYRLKLLKQRDGDFLKSQIRINLNPKYLTLENDVFPDSL